MRAHLFSVGVGGRTLTPTRDGSSFRSSLRSSEHGKSVCVLRLGPQADNAVTLGEGDGFILSAASAHHLSFSRTTTHEGGSAPTRRGSSFSLPLRLRTYWSTKGLPALVQVSAAIQPIEPSHTGIVWRLYSARISVLYSLGFVGAGTPASTAGKRLIFGGGGTCLSGAAPSVVPRPA
jgi:hypothetical protein